MKTKSHSMPGTRRRAGLIFVAVALATLLGFLRSSGQINWGTALSFDGVNDYVVFDRPVSNDFTLECWFQTAQISGNGSGQWWEGMGLVDGEVNGVAFDFGLSLGGGKLLFGSGDNRPDTTIRSGFVADGQWHHAAVTRQRSSGVIQLYVDGQLAASGVAGTATLGGPPQMRLGSLASGVNFFQGQIDEVRIWNVVRSGDAIREAMSHPLSGTEANLVTYYRLDEGAGPTAHDTTANHFDALLVNGPSWGNRSVPLLVTLPAGVWSTTAATLNGWANPNSRETAAWFEWGPNTGYGSRTAITNVGSGTNLVPVNYDLTGLSPGQTYHYRLVISNSVGLAVASDVVFATPASFFSRVATLPGTAYGHIAWGDYNNDGLLDILRAGFISPNTYIAQVWRNNGNGTFTDIGVPLPGVSYAWVAWGDYDNDGFLDFLLRGSSPSGSIIQLWRNNGNGTFTTVPISLLQCRSFYWGDYDNDGRLDLLGLGDARPNYPGHLWRNTGSGFTEALSIPGYARWGATGDYNDDGRLDFVAAGDFWTETYVNNWPYVYELYSPMPRVNNNVQAVACGDYDNDGRPDILLTGQGMTPLVPMTQVWQGRGWSSFSNIGAQVTPVGESSAAWGDYDNDGRLDILLTGSTTGYDYHTAITQVWRNTGSGFVNISAGLPGIYQGYAVWGDYDNDGRLDVLLTGWPTTSGAITELWRNVGPVQNSPPTAPTQLTAAVAGHDVRLAWNPAIDSQTPSLGLSYNLRIGTNSGGYDTVSPQSSPVSGFRRLPALGNVQQGTNAAFPELPFGVYYWSVQAVDHAFAGSPFAAESRFVVAVETLPATCLSHTSETLHGRVHALGYPTAAWFEWGLTTNYGNVTATNTTSDSSPNPLSVDITGLQLATYHYRAVASNELGFHVGADSAFTVRAEPPAVAALSISEVTPTSLRLSAAANPRWAETVAWFEYGLSTKYGSSTPAVNLGHGPDPLPFSSPVTGLLPWMTYHFRAVGSNSVGRADGPDTVLTLGAPALSAPSISTLSDVSIPQGSSTSVNFSVFDPDTPLEQLVIRAQANNPVLLPSVAVGGSGSARVLTLTPEASHSGAAVVTVTVSDGTSTVGRTFTLTVTPSAEYRSPLLVLANTRLTSTEAWRFHLQDAGTGSTNYEVEYRPDFSPTNWWIRATNVSSPSAGVFEVDIGPPQPGTGFYRVKGLRLLSGGLQVANLTLEEGAAVTGPVLIFNGPYVGAVSYTCSGSWGTTNGTVQVNGTTAVIPVPLVDNIGIEALRSLTLCLLPGSGYALTGITQGNVVITENDADWQGTLVIPNELAGSTTASLTNGSGGFTKVLLVQNANVLVGFTLRLQQSNGVYQGLIRSDGSGFFPTNALTQLALTENSFSAVATNVPLPALTGSVFFDAPHHLDLRLDAANAPGQTNVSANRISGTATMVSVVPGRPWLDSSLPGSFLLLKPAVVPSTNEVPLYPSP